MYATVGVKAICNVSLRRAKYNGIFFIHHNRQRITRVYYYTARYGRVLRVGG